MAIAVIYYIEVNVICIIILLLIWQQLSQNFGQFSTARMIFSRMLWVAVLLCVSDLIASAFNGQVFPGARAILQISNLIFYEGLTVISYLWMLYVFVKLNRVSDNDVKIFRLSAIPLVLFTLLALTNHRTSIFFTLDEHNVYARNFGIYIHWAVTWMYLIIPTLYTARLILREKSKYRRKEMAPLLYFIIAPAAASVVQMLFYGVSASQVGITLSAIMFSFLIQNNQILTDSLTGLNNRRGLENYLADHIQHHEENSIVLLMIDINNFKQINDRFGHLTGDRALRDAAETLRQVCRETTSRLFLCRYGGDEFVLSGPYNGPDETEALKSLIQEVLGEKSEA